MYNKNNRHKILWPRKKCTGTLSNWSKPLVNWLQLDLSFRRGVKSAAFDKVHVHRSRMRELKFLPGNTQGSVRVSTLNAGELTDFGTAQEIPEKVVHWKNTSWRGIQSKKYVIWRLRNKSGTKSTFPSGSRSVKMRKSNNICLFIPSSSWIGKKPNCFSIALPDHFCSSLFISDQTWT